MKRESFGKNWRLWLVLTIWLLALSGCSVEESRSVNENKPAQEITETVSGNVVSEETANSAKTAESAETMQSEPFDLAQIPDYTGEPAVEVNGNQPYFSDSELTTKAFEQYSDLDSLGRCGVAYANICKEIMPTEERGAIGQVKPSGWHTVKYNDLIDGNYLYNRCHLIGYQLAGENANEKNLITGTRYLNTEGMLPYENQVADYVKSTGNHVLYRVTPIFEGDNLVASGVLMEAKSVEDKGKGICFCVYVYDCQPGISIDYATGDSERDGNYSGTGTKKDSSETQSSQQATTTKPQQTEPQTQQSDDSEAAQNTYILNTSTHKFHKPGCSAVKTMAEHNMQTVTDSRETILSDGYEPCKRCNP